MFIDKVTKGNRFLKTRLADKHYCIVAYICKEYVTLAHNWYLHLSKLGLQDLVILVCLDNESYIYARTNHIPAIYADQNKIIDSLKTNVLSNAWRSPSHVCQAQVAHLITQTYQTDVIWTDVDMVFTKKSFISKIYDEINKGFDTCIYTNASYDEIADGSYDLSVSRNGGMMLLWSKSFVKSLIKNVQNGPTLVIDVPDKNVTLNDIGNAFNIKATNLHPFLFTNTTFWMIDQFRNSMHNMVYAVHYNKICDVTVLNSQELGELAEIKAKLMKQCGHWLLN